MTKSAALSPVSLPGDGVRAYARSPFVLPKAASLVPSPNADPLLTLPWSTIVLSRRVSATPPSSVIPVVYVRLPATVPL